MPSTTTYSRGEVVLVPFPFTNLTAVKQRPALVVSPDTLNQARPHVVVVAITSQVPPQLAADEMAVPAPELALWGLPKPSILKLAKLFTIHQGLIRRTLGTAPAASLETVLRRIQRQFALVLPVGVHAGARSIQPRDRVVLTAPLPEEGLAEGDVGTVMHLHPANAGYEVEFQTLTGDPVIVATVLPGLLRPVDAHDLAHARSLPAGH